MQLKLIRTARRRSRLCGWCRCSRRIARCYCRCWSYCWCRCRSSCYCSCRCWCRRTHRGSKAGLIFLFADLLHFRTLQRDDATSAGVLHFHRAGTREGINLLRVIRSARVWVRHLVIGGGTPANKQAGAQTCGNPSKPHRLFHDYFPFIIDTAVGLRLARSERGTAPLKIPGCGESSIIKIILFILLRY